MSWSPSDNLSCPRCETLLPLHAEFCNSCGERVEKRNGEWKKHAENGDDDAQEPEVDTEHTPSPLQRSLKRLQSSELSKNNTIPGQPHRSSSAPQDVEATIAIEQSLSTTSAPSIPETWQQVPETEVPIFLTEELTTPSIPVPDTDTKKNGSVPFSQRLKRRITGSLPAVSLAPQRKVASNPSGSNWFWPTIIILSAVAASLVNFVFTDTAIRPIIVIWFLLVCPGMMLVRFLRLNEPAVEWTLAIALSFAIDAIVASIQLYAGRWSPTGTISILISLSLGGAIIQLAITSAKKLSMLSTALSSRSRRDM